MGDDSGFTTTVRVVAPPDHAVRGFARWVAASVEPSAHVLNIGAGRNLSGALLPVRRRAARIVGVDPDESIRHNPHLDEWHRATLEDFAATHVEEFDVAMSVFVLEHVCDPEAFTAACFRTLKPGGVLFALTVHKFQYFGLTTWATTRLHVNERLLRRLKGEEVVNGYHFPTEYRMNSPHQCSGHLERAGFRSAEYRMFDKPELYAWYLPKPLKPLAPAWSRMAYKVNSPLLMGSLSFRAER
jgi:SAM-dependent methyltransferase